MKKFLLVIVVLAAIIGAFAIYLVATTPKTSAGVRFPLTNEHRALIAHVPRSADAFALIPTAAALDAKLRANPITRGAIDDWSEKHLLPRPWMIGGADLLVWRDGKQTRYFLRLDPLRGVIVRIYLMMRGDSSGTLLINAPPSEGLDADEVARITALAQNLPQADALVVQRDRARGAFPPIGRPAVTSLQIQPRALIITSRAANDSTEPAVTLNARYPRGAMLTATFAQQPRSLDDLNRLFGEKVSPLFSGGGAIALYDVDVDKLLPRPLGVLLFPADDERRAALDTLTRRAGAGQLLGINARTAEKDGQLLLSFDGSIDTYINDAIEPVTYPAALWAMRIDAQRLAPILERLNDNVGLRLAAPHLFRSARDLQRWIGALKQSSSIEAVDTIDAGGEQLRVTIASK